MQKVDFDETGFYTIQYSHIGASRAKQLNTALAGMAKAAKRAPGWWVLPEGQEYPLLCFMRAFALDTYATPQAAQRLKTRLLNDRQAKSKWVASSWSTKGEFPDILTSPLYDYQKAGAAYLAARKGAILADEPGLGKTLQALAVAKHLELWPLLVVAPDKVLEDWYRACLKFANVQPYKFDGKIGPHTFGVMRNRKVTIVGQDQLHKLAERDIDLIPWGAAVIDEAHNFKNPTARRTKALMRVISKAGRVYALTGTPVLNRVDDLMQLLEITRLLPFFGGVEVYKRLYCGRNAKGDKNKLGETLRWLGLVGRKGEDVLKDLPAKHIHWIEQPISNRLDYVHAETDLISWLQEQGKTEKLPANFYAERLAKVYHLRSLAAMGRMEQSINFVKSKLNEGEKVLVFAHHKHVLDRVYQELQAYKPVMIRGDLSKTACQQAKDRFQDSERCRVILCSIRAAGVGITLTAGATVVFLECDWVAKINEQAEARAHRIGQTKEVNVYYLYDPETIEGHIFQVLKRKAALARQIQEAGYQDAESTNEANEVLTQLVQAREPA